MRPLPFGLRLRDCATAFLASVFQAFGIYNIHAVADVTEGGVLGATLLLDHWLGISPAWTSLLLNGCCYALGIRTLGRHFLVYSALSAGTFSAVYALLEQFPRLWPELSRMPLAASILGALFVGFGIGLCVRTGGAPTGDDALAMSLSARFHLPIERVYLMTDLTVLALSLSYLSPARITCSLLTVILSGKIIGIVQRFQQPICR